MPSTRAGSQKIRQKFAVPGRCGLPAGNCAARSSAGKPTGSTASEFQKSQKAPPIARPQPALGDDSVRRIFFVPRYGNNAILSLDQTRFCLTTKHEILPLLAGDIPIPGLGRLLPYITYLCISSWPQRQAPPGRLCEGDPERRHSLARTPTLELRN